MLSTLAEKHSLNMSFTHISQIAVGTSLRKEVVS